VGSAATMVIGQPPELDALELDSIAEALYVQLKSFALLTLEEIG